jgi:hypothetical protein
MLGGLPREYRQAHDPCVALTAAYITCEYDHPQLGSEVNLPRRSGSSMGLKGRMGWVVAGGYSGRKRGLGPRGCSLRHRPQRKNTQTRLGKC